MLGDCSNSCGGGVRINVREKTVQEMYGGTCEGNPTFEESCNLQECPGIISLSYNSLQSSMLSFSFVVFDIFNC